jgi:hypothetical protein
MYKNNKNNYRQIRKAIAVFVFLAVVRVGYAAQEYKNIDPLIAQKVAQRKAAEQEITESEIFKNLIDRLNKKHDQEAEQKVRADMAKLEALFAQLQAEGTPAEQISVELKALNNLHRQADKLFLARQKAEKRSEIQRLVAQKWPGYVHYDLEFKNY